jgi:Na+-transporting NADH:ubiquinone oxidoreductase subunit NqrD
MKRMLATVLIFEAIVVGLAVPVAVHIDHLRPWSAGVAAGVTAGAALLFAILARPLLPATLIGGSVLQVFVIASGAIVPVMYFLGAIFALLWVVGIWLGRRIERPAGP